MFRDGTLADFEIIVNGMSIRAHKYVLARSPVFLAMIQNEMVEGKSQKVNIDHIAFGVMQEMISFMYTSKVQDLETMAGDLLIAADYYDLPDLKDICQKWLEANITFDNFAHSLEIAVRYDIESLKDFVLKFIIK